MRIKAPDPRRGISAGRAEASGEAALEVSLHKAGAQSRIPSAPADLVLGR